MSSKVKIVGIGIPCLLVGGTEIQTLNLVKALVLEEYQVTVICYFEHDAYIVDEFRKIGAKIVLLEWDRAIGAISFIHKLASELKKFSFDIFHVQYVAPGALPIVAAKFAGVGKILATVHQPKTESHGKFAGLILKTASVVCDVFLSVSKSTEKSWFGSSHVFNNNIAYKKLPKHCTIYNTLDTKYIDSRLKDLSTLYGDEKSYRIGTVCRLDYVKGVDILINAFSIVKKDEKSSLKLLIYGEGRDEGRLRKLVTSLGLDESVVFCGKLLPADVISETAHLDIVVVPSRFEAFGLYAAEAMYMKKPVIASDAFGLAEVITHGKTGLLFPIGDTATLADQIKLLLCNPRLRVSLAEEGRNSIKSRFDFEHYQNSIAGLYRLM
ncbi:glycosyltransferase family 4 protein [Algoriphagus halophytocola]|uniref:Glycosyltransferase family 4 protein n=1 Tax=Algoriphagus halophytocola TaxID=2991499 RepID=A0ABY6MKX8_9BACT|nr:MULTISPECIES: glycosyltransferase family 4 protein [unclassified Algoriphagus]UZD23047.1 glycosyltransferase family 4 protein [Algoriphagus sp. TR-M5]WBL44339.1 glycosyltransferase family 4 protein [Algoriphagus sp. TR-M9]